MGRWRPGRPCGAGVRRETPDGCPPSSRRRCSMKRASLHRLAWLGVVLALVGPLTAQAGEGHDHGGAPAAPSANGPHRQPDGSAFLPKPAQRQLGVRTMVAAEAELPRSVELNGKVLIDPNAGGK